mgnify:FL=1
MKLLMTEHYRDSQVALIQGDEVEVSGQLASWLIENGKAKAIEQPKEKPAEVKNDEVRESNLDNRRKR